MPDAVGSSSRSTVSQFPAGSLIIATRDRGRWTAHPLRAAATVIGVMAALHLWSLAAGVHDLAPDEAHYWEWSRQLDWSYYSKGPLVAYLIALSTRLGEPTAFFVRLPALMLSLGTTYIVYFLARGGRTGLYAVLLVSACPLLNVGGMLMTTDVPLLFCWALLLYSVRRALNGGGSAWWLICGACLGVGFLAKYSMLLVLPCLALAAWRTPALARALRTRRPYAALLIAALCVGPVILWNGQHDWVSARHVGTLAGVTAPTVLSPSSLWKFIGGQLGIVTPALLVLLCATLMRCRRARGDEWLLWCVSAPVLLLFLALSLMTDVEANWAAPGYVGALVLAAAGSTRSVVRVRPLVLIAFVLVPGWSVNLVAHFPALLPSIGIHLPPRLDPTARLAGWEDLGRAVGRIRLSERADTFLMSESYQVASALAFYTPGQPRVYNINLGRRLNQYDVWGGLTALAGRDGLYVTAGRWDGTHPVRAACARLDPVDVIDIERWGEVVRTFSVLRCVAYRGLPDATVATY